MTVESGCAGCARPRAEAPAADDRRSHAGDEMAKGGSLRAALRQAMPGIRPGDRAYLETITQGLIDMVESMAFEASATTCTWVTVALA